MNILVISDDPRVTCTIQYAAEELGSVHQIFLASSPKKALHILYAYCISLVFFEQNMSQMNNRVFLETHKPDFPETDWIILSTSKRFYDVKQAMEWGLKDYLLKPLDGAEVQEIIKHTCSLHKPDLINPL